MTTRIYRRHGDLGVCTLTPVIVGICLCSTNTVCCNSGYFHFTFGPSVGAPRTTLRFNDSEGFPELRKAVTVTTYCSKGGEARGGESGTDRT